MSTENKSVDLSIETQVGFGILMQFEDVTTVNGFTTSEPINLTGCTFKGSIKLSLNPGTPVLESFAIVVADTAKGIVSMGLTKAQTLNLSSKASSKRDPYNPRLRFVGYYDVILVKVTNGTSSETRILEGKVYVSDGVTP